MIDRIGGASGCKTGPDMPKRPPGGVAVVTAERYRPEPGRRSSRGWVGLIETPGRRLSDASAGAPREPGSALLARLLDGPHHLVERGVRAGHGDQHLALPRGPGGRLLRRGGTAARHDAAA